MNEADQDSNVCSLAALPAETLERLAEDCCVVLDRIRSAADKVNPTSAPFRKLFRMMQQVASLLDSVMAAQAKQAHAQDQRRDNEPPAERTAA